MTKFLNPSAFDLSQNDLESFTYMEIGKTHKGGPLNWELKKSHIRKVYPPSLTMKARTTLKKKAS